MGPLWSERMHAASADTPPIWCLQSRKGHAARPYPSGGEGGAAEELSHLPLLGEPAMIPPVCYMNVALRFSESGRGSRRKKARPQGGRAGVPVAPPGAGGVRQRESGLGGNGLAGSVVLFAVVVLALGKVQPHGTHQSTSERSQAQLLRPK